MKKAVNVRTICIAAAMLSVAVLANAGDLIGHWPLDGSAGDSRGANNGTWSGTEAYAEGKLGQAGSFNGASLIELGSVMPAGAYTKSAWIYRTADAANSVLSGATGPAGSSHALRCSSGNGNKLSSGHASDVVQSAAALPQDTWVHVAVTYDPNVAGGTLKLYLNGAPVSGTPTATGIGAPTDSSAQIAALLKANCFQGRIDDVGLWNEALSDAMIAEVYTQGLDGNSLSDLWPSGKVSNLTAGAGAVFKVK